MKYRDALFCMNESLLNNSLPFNPIRLWRPNNSTLNDDLSPRESLGSKWHKSVFDRHGYTLDSGEKIKLTSHQARHLLDTIAQRGGLSQLEIAKWAGRADVKQNRTYNHMSEFEMVAKAEELDTSLTLFGPPGEVAKRIPITIPVSYTHLTLPTKA